MEIEKGETLTFYEPLSFESFISIGLIQPV